MMRPFVQPQDGPSEIANTKLASPRLTNPTPR